MCALGCNAGLDLSSLHTEELGPWLSATVCTRKLGPLHMLYKGQFLAQVGEISTYNLPPLPPLYKWLSQGDALYFRYWIVSI